MLTFNIWGEFTDVLSFTQLEDMEVGQRKDFKRVWGLYGEGRLREHVTSIAYVARVRLATGETLVADPGPILELAQEIQSDITIEDLEPEPEPLPRV